MDNKTVREFMQHHNCLVEDLRVSANLLPKKQEILKENLNRYADELAEYNHYHSKEYTSPFKVQTMNEVIQNAFPAWKEQKDWNISPDGDLLHNKTKYQISAQQLGEKDWILHMMGKRWVNLNTLIPAYLEACRRAGVDELQIITHYK